MKRARSQKSYYIYQTLVELERVNGNGDCKTFYNKATIATTTYLIWVSSCIEYCVLHVVHGHLKIITPSNSFTSAV